MREWLILLQGICLICNLTAQSNLIQWSNPSFEDVPGPGRPPLGWYFCGPLNETPPDIHPVYTLNVTQIAKHGKTYAGLVVRDNGTQETLGQSIDHHLKIGACYQVRLYACRSNSYSSYSRLTGLPANFSQPIKLQLWAGSQHCQSETLLAETPAITDTTWQIYELNFSPQVEYNQLFFTANHLSDSLFYNGHLLLDNLSPIISVDCENGKPLSTESENGSQTVSSEEKDLTSDIQQEIVNVRWARNGFSLAQQLIPGPGKTGAWITGNLAIYRIAHSLAVHPEALLTVAVGPRKDPLLQHHIRLLAAEFLAAGLPPDRCLIRPLRKKDLRHDGWLNSDYEESHLLWGVSE